MKGDKRGFKLCLVPDIQGYGDPQEQGQAKE